MRRMRQRRASLLCLLLGGRPRDVRAALHADLGGGEKEEEEEEEEEEKEAQEEEDPPAFVPSSAWAPSPSPTPNSDAIFAPSSTSTSPQ